MSEHVVESRDEELLVDDLTDKPTLVVDSKSSDVSEMAGKDAKDNQLVESYAGPTLHTENASSSAADNAILADNTEVSHNLTKEVVATPSTNEQSSLKEHEPAGVESSIYKHEIADAESEDNISDADSEDKTADADSEDKTADAGSEDNIADTGSEDKTADAGSEDNIADTGSEDKTADAGSEDKTADAGSEDKTADADSADKTADADSEDNTADADSGDNTAETDSSIKKEENVDTIDVDEDKLLKESIRESHTKEEANETKPTVQQKVGEKSTETGTKEGTSELKPTVLENSEGVPTTTDANEGNEATREVVDPEAVFLYTSLTAGGFHVMSDTNRLSTILTSNKIEFTMVDLATNERAKRIWKWRGKGKKLPAVVRDDEIIGDITEIEDANEFGEVRDMVLGDI
jgi:hypothetical protein